MKQLQSEENLISFTHISKNIIIEKQLLQEPPIKTYKPSHLRFHNSDEEEDIMEWMNLEPPMHEKVSIVISKKKMLKKLIHEQNLHPVAKAMINLQLHTRRAPYTEEEKNLSRQLYFYSPSAFCRLRKAGCNFPGQRTIRGWLEEFNIQPGFCDFIFEKLKEKISHIR
ncbi:hypothetical protein P5V15_002867 [Pogonomyrmex californicus]